MQFGSIALVNGNAATSRLFIAKWSKASNAFVWAQAINGSSANIYANGLAVNGSNIYLTGYFAQGTVQFGTITLTLASSFPAKALFVAKLTDAGTTASFTWAQQSASPSTGAITRLGSIAVAGANVYVAGTLGGTIDFGGGNLSTSTPNDVNADTEGFIVKHTDAGATGRFVWAQQVGGASSDYITKVAVGSAGRVYVCGSFDSRANFGPLSLTSAGGEDGFIAKLTDSGTSSSFAWAQRLGGTVTDAVRSMAVSGPAVYITGQAQQDADFGNIRLSNSGAEMFAAKLTDSGTSSSFVWVQAAYADAVDIAVKGTSVYLIGKTRFPGYWGTIYSPHYTGEMYLAKIRDSGTTSVFSWLQTTSQSFNLTASSLVVSGADVYASGLIADYATFGSIPKVTTAHLQALSFLAFVTDNTLLASKAASPVHLGIYPNPAQGSVHVVNAGVATQLSLLDNLGRAVRQGSGTTLSVQGVAPGFYMLQATTPGQATRTARILVE
ncbi:T9SS type A sorting domain-containing protein [Hymenobacter elongatus]|uniref:T9SS type A sorting domain-containing protein n=1 Tax=Hymenobacter elongatus TaxID=877208 RepID=UPI0014369412|nr:T9SS type A sorting domain-containing protein [Hymenobacter elongatus]